jgi:CubicO group peptidase (beta-lactamase class C family)
VQCRLVHGTPPVCPFEGSILLATRHGKIFYESTVGYPRDDMIFRLYSMSKQITATAVMMLVGAGAARV